MTKVSAYTRQGKPVSGYERGKPDPEDGTGVEVPHVAPKAATPDAPGRPKIVDVPKAGEPRKPSNVGVTIMGGSQHGQRKAPEIKHGKRV